MSFLLVQFWVKWYDGSVLFKVGNWHCLKTTIYYNFIYNAVTNVSFTHNTSIYSYYIIIIVNKYFFFYFSAQCVVIITNDEGSKNLSAQSVFNSTIRLVKTNDCMQDLAANGRLFTMWQEMTSHQLSHLRRVVKSVLNAKLVLRWHYH